MSESPQAKAQRIANYLRGRYSEWTVDKIGASIPYHHWLDDGARDAYWIVVATWRLET